MTFNRYSLCAVVLAALLPASAPAHAAPASPAPPLSCLIVGGGPDKENNQVAIESNVRYVRSLVPAGSLVHVLYTNGNPASRIVQYEDDDGGTRYRATSLGKIDGPSNLHAFRKFAGYMGRSGAPMLLYFTGHGSPDREGGFDENAYDFWGEDMLAVSDLADTVENLDPRVPLTLVMVQCFSGAFARVLFESTPPQPSPPGRESTESTPPSAGRPRVRPGSCGFFASVPQREAAGCTSEVDEANYHDFTTYFFGALSGHDRVGRPISTADYDHDGVVEMDEAYAYALMNDPSIDTPMATSDDYVRRYVKSAPADIFSTPYSTALSYGSPAQRAALESLSKQLKLTGEDRLKVAYSVFTKRTSIPETNETEDQEEQTARWIRFVRLSKTVIIEHRIEKSGPDDVRAGLDELLKAEHRNPLIPKLLRAAAHS